MLRFNGLPRRLSAFCTCFSVSEAYNGLSLGRATFYRGDPFSELTDTTGKGSCFASSLTNSLLKSSRMFRTRCLVICSNRSPTRRKAEFNGA
jgi:hypothetical protein